MDANADRLESTRLHLANFLNILQFAERLQKKLQIDLKTKGAASQIWSELEKR